MGKAKTKFDVGKNVKSTFSNSQLMQYLEIIGIALYAVGVPTLLKVKGWAGYAMAYGVPLVMGAILNRPAMFAGGLAGASIHAMFYGGDKVLKDSTGEIKSTWGIEAGTSGLSDGATNYSAGRNSLPPGVDLVNLDGRLVAVENRATINDYIPENESIGFLNDYVEEGETINFLNDYTDSDNIRYSDSLQINGTI